jgi:hypothetical protein
MRNRIIEFNHFIIWSAETYRWSIPFTGIGLLAITPGVLFLVDRLLGVIFNFLNYGGQAGTEPLIGLNLPLTLVGLACIIVGLLFLKLENISIAGEYRRRKRERALIRARQR